MRKLIVTEEDKLEFIRLLNESSLDRPLIAEFKVYRRQRTLRSNALLWLWLRCIADECGYDKRDQDDLDSIKDYYCERFLGWGFKKVMGTFQKKVQGTSGLNTKEFSTFLEQIRVSAMQEHGIHLPLPEEQGYDEFYTRYGVE